MFEMDDFKTHSTLCQFIYFHSIKQSPSQQLAFASFHLIGRKQNTVMIEERIGIDKRRGKQGEHRKDYLLFFAEEGDGFVILKGFEGMFTHLLNGLKGLKASIFLCVLLGGR